MNPRFDQLVGNYVEIITDRYVSMRSESEHGISEKRKPLVVSGYFLDYDDTWVYIGAEEGALSDFIKIKRIISIGVSTPSDAYEEILDEMDEKDYEIN